MVKSIHARSIITKWARKHQHQSIGLRYVEPDSLWPPVPYFDFMLLLRAILLEYASIWPEYPSGCDNEHQTGLESLKRRYFWLGPCCKWLKQCSRRSQPAVKHKRVVLYPSRRTSGSKASPELRNGSWCSEQRRPCHYDGCRVESVCHDSGAAYRRRITRPPAIRMLR